MLHLLCIYMGRIIFLRKCNMPPTTEPNLIAAFHAAIKLLCKNTRELILNKCVCYPEEYVHL